MKRFLLLMFCLQLAACAHAPKQESLKDPWEGWNRKVFAFNTGFDAWVTKPIAKAYHFILPQVLDDGVSNAFSNIKELPRSFFAILQGKPKSTGISLLRFLVNSTIGVLGLFDIASQMGLEKQQRDFGQTLAVWGVPSGNYLVLPFIGPSTFRESAGFAVGAFVAPTSFIKDRSLRDKLWALALIDTRADLLKLEDLITGDPYIFIRSAFWQNRQNMNLDGKVKDNFDNPAIDDGEDWLKDE